MPGSRASYVASRSTAVALLLGAGCTIVNTFEEVKPRPEGTYDTSAPPVLDATTVDVERVDASDSGGDAADAAQGSGGAIVVGGYVEDDAGATTYVLAVLDPATGRELGTREPMVVAAIRYDGLRDLWYLFESKSGDFVPGPNDEVVLHVRSLDAKTGAWTEHSNRIVPTMHFYESIAVVRERIGYVAYVGADAGNALDFVVLDTSSATQVTDVNRLPIDVTPLGVTSNRSVTGPGGVVNLVRLTGCGASCNVELVSVQIPNSGLPFIDAPVVIGTSARFATPSYASMTSANRDLVVFPRAATDAAAPSFAARFDPRTHAPEGPRTPFFINDSALRRAAVSDCTSTAFVVGTNSDLKVHAVPLLDDGGGTPTSESTQHSGQAVYFEPTSKTVLAPFAQGSGFDFSAFRLGGAAEAPTLTKRIAPDWSPPADLRPVLLGIRQPVPITCP